MIKERYCSYEISKLLKEKGFKESTQFVWYEHLPSPNAAHNSEIGKPKRDYFYWEEEGERNSPWTNNSPIPSYINGEVYSCPTHQMAMDWIREKHNILIWFTPVIPGLISKDETVFYWKWKIKRKLHSCSHIQNHIKYKTYEEAVEAALKYSLENLI